MRQKNRRVYIGSAWPYVNGRLHLGHAAGLLPADTLARYHRLIGDDVLWTSGSDCHGTPITERARAEGCTPREIAERYHTHMVEDFGRLGFSYSLYWATMESKHHERVQESFLDLWHKGYIVEGDYHMATCAVCNENRSDREINGSCPKCEKPGARGDQCDACGEMLNPFELKDPTCTKCRGPITFETSRELYLNLPALAPQIASWVRKQDHWRDNAKALTEAWLHGGLKPRAITRNLDWGIKVPLDGWDNRRIYVWFEAVHGYLTASMEWAQQQGNVDAWKPFWLQGDDRILAYYVIGKDNIPFHTLIWPAILMAKDGYVLPWHIVSSEFLNIKGEKLSKSAGRMIYVHEFLDHFDPDLLRYFLLADGPETQDTNFTWDRFLGLVNGEVVNNYSNLVHRLLSFVDKQCEGKVPSPGSPVAADLSLRALCDRAFVEVGECIERTEFRRAVEAIMNLVQETNRYFTEQQPWTVIKTDRKRAEMVINTGLHVLASLSILLDPFMPSQANRLRGMLALGLNEQKWLAPDLQEGHRIGIVAPLFQRIDKKMLLEAPLDPLGNPWS